jgi:hypothetical protein
MEYDDELIRLKERVWKLESVVHILINMHRIKTPEDFWIYTNTEENLKIADFYDATRD